MKPMRSEKEMFDLILSVAKEDPRIRAVVLNGSRSNPEAPRDQYQDYDIVYCVDDVAPFYNNPDWISEKFGPPLVMQMPEAISPPGLEPDNNGSFVYLMLFDDGNRIDLTIDTQYTLHEDGDNDPAVALLDKCGCLPSLSNDSSCWHVSCPDEKLFLDCCNEFWWCLNNVAKGIARDERPYAMEMYNCHVRDMLNHMVSWYIGISTDFSVSSGKMGKYFKNHLPADIYAEYLATYSDSEPNHLWEAVFAGCALFRKLALAVAKKLGFHYRLDEDENMNKYLRHVQNA